MSKSSASPSTDTLLLPYQSRWVGDRARVAVIEKSRQIGISWAQAAMTALVAARANRGGSTYYVSYNHDMTRQFVEDVAKAAKAFELASQPHEAVLKDGDEDVTVWRVTFASGREVVGMTSRPRVLRSRRGHVIIDEAAFVDDLEAVIDAAMAMLIWGWSVRIISTHFGDTNPFADLVNSIRNGEKPYSLHTVTFEAAVRDGLYRRILAMQGDDAWSPNAEREWVAEIRASYGDRASQELDCIPAAGTGRYFPALLIENAMDADIPVLEWRAPAEDFTYWSEGEREHATAGWIGDVLEPAVGDVDARGCYCAGMDIARSGDLSVIALVQQAADRVTTVVQVELRDMPFSEQQRVLHWLLDRVRVRRAAIDTRGIGHMLGEQAAQKFGPDAIEQVMISPKTHAESWPPYKQLLEDHAYVLPKHDGVRDDHRVVQLVDGAPRVAGATGTREERRHGDAAVAHMLATRAVRDAAGAGYMPFAYHAVPPAGRGRWRGQPSGGDERAFASERQRIWGDT